MESNRRVRVGLPIKNINMDFSEETIRQAWDRANGKCECTRTICGHSGRCNKELRWESRGSESEYGWEAHHIDSNGPNTLSNCEILCQECHKNTQSYGK